MSRHVRAALVLAAVSLPLLALAPALGARAAVQGTRAAAVVHVTIQNFAFSPQTVTVAPGTTVVWTQKDSAPHNVTSDTNAWLASANLSPGQSFSHTFTKAGSYAYHCSVHPNMVATVVVSSAGSGSTQGSGMGMGMMGPTSMSSMTVWTGYYDGHKVQYISTDTSSKAEALRDHINYAPILAKSLPSTSLIYFVTNGKFAARGPAFGSQPGDSAYTPLWQEVLVTWKDPSKAVFLGSDNDVNAMAKAGKLTLKMTGIVLNCPILKVMSGSGS